MLGDYRAVLLDALGERRVFARVDHVHAAAENGDGSRPGVERRAVRHAVHAPRQPADYRNAAGGYLRRQLSRGFAPVSGRSARPDHRHRALVAGQNLALDVQQRRLVVNLLQARRIVVVVPSQRADAGADDALHLIVRVDLASGFDDLARGGSVQPRAAQVRQPRAPSLAKRAEMPFHQRHPRAPDPGHAVEGDPVFKLRNFHAKGDCIFI